MSYSLVSPNTFALKLKIHCKICEKKLRNMLLKIQGVQSVQIDEKLGNLVISGTVDPTTILTMLEKLGRKAELIWEQGQPINVQTITQSKVINSLNDSDIITRQLEQLSRIPGLQTMEVITTIRLTIQGESRNDPTDKVLEIRTTNNLNKPSHPFDHSDGDGGGGFCAASSSCCGCHHDAITHSQNIHGCCCHGDNTSKNNCWGKAHPSDSQPPLAPSGSQPPLALTPPSWSSGSTIASAPPLPYDFYHYQAPPPPSSSPIHHTYYNALSDENANGCAIL